MKFIMLEKAKQKKSIVKNFLKLEDFKRDQDKSSRNYTNTQGGAFIRNDDDFELLYGLENE